MSLFDSKVFGQKYFWWGFQIILIAGSCFFMVFGIQLLQWAYSLGDPFSFIMSFFSASLIILISAAVIIGLIFRMIYYYRKMDDSSE